MNRVMGVQPENRLGIRRYSKGAIAGLPPKAVQGRAGGEHHVTIDDPQRVPDRSVTAHVTIYDPGGAVAVPTAATLIINCPCSGPPGTNAFTLITFDVHGCEQPRAVAG